MYVKKLDYQNKHNGVTYQLGINTYNPEKHTNKVRGGISFYDPKDIALGLLEFGNKIAVVEIPENEQIIQIGYGLKANKINITQIIPVFSIEGYKWISQNIPNINWENFYKTAKFRNKNELTEMIYKEHIRKIESEL